MKNSKFKMFWRRILGAVAFFHFSFFIFNCPAFPPAPHHLIYGLVRDELGHPIIATNATLIFSLETAAGTQIKTTIIPHMRPNMNYQLEVPMDSGITADAYKPTALRPTVPFRIKAKIGNITYIPIEMVLNVSSLGNPAKKTRIDLTLGQDLDGDGIPDAWENMLISAAGGGLNLTNINGGDDFDGDGISNFAEYIAGTYAFDPEDGFNLKIAGFNNGAPLLDFLAIRGRSYTVYGSTDLKTWIAVEFRIPAEGPNASIRQAYQATDVRNLRIEVVPSTGPTRRFYKAMVQ